MTDEPAVFAWRWLLGAALAYVILQAVVAGRYGFHRDELYFLEAGRHLALGYVDQPPLVPLLARLQPALFGTSPWALRALPILAGATTAPLAGALARELGGGRHAQAWAGAAVASATLVLTFGHLLSTATFDFVLWLALLVVATRMLRTDEPRLWVAFGGLAGVALWNKHLPVLLVLALLTGLAVERRWELLRSRWLVAGGALAAVLIAPHVAWQAANGWPQLGMAAALSARLGVENRVTLLPLQLIMLGPLLIPMAVAGVRWLLGDGRGFRSLLWAYVTALVLTFVSGGRPYYPMALAAVLVVAGVVATSRRSPRSLPRLVGLNLLVGLPIALPVLPVGVLAATPIGAVNDTLVEQIGWPELAEQVAEVVAALPTDEADRVVLLTGSYGEAGALDHYGPALGLPPAYSGHNSYWYWRRPTDDDATVVAVRVSSSTLEEHFAACTPAGPVTTPAGIDNEVRGAPITVCRGLRGTWAEHWPALRHRS